MSSTGMKVELLEERWTPTTIQTTFVFHSLPRTVKSSICIDLPLLNLGWTFVLSLKPARDLRNHGYYRQSKSCTDWIPATFSFRQDISQVSWGNTSVHAQLSYDSDDVNSNVTSLATMKIISLADTPSLDLPLAKTCTISSLRSNKVQLIVTVSECPLSNGLFGARLNTASEAQYQTQLIRRSGERLMSRSLATGKLFDVKFMTPSTRSSGITGKHLPTYASLSILEERVNMSSSILRESWTNALVALDSSGTEHVEEILCPKDYEYELDSDFEDEWETSPHDSGGARDLPAPQAQQSESSSSSSKSSDDSSSSFELEGVNNQSLIDHQFGEFMKGPKEPPFDSERTVWVKFAAHRTWHAFLWYCYTGNLEFGKLKSQVEPDGQHLRVRSVQGGPPTCSPKSMYRLADLVGDKSLKAVTLKAIKERMTEVNILDETFSVFTSRYPDVREMQLGILMEHCGSPSVKKAFLKAMVKYGSMPHAEPVLSTFYDKLVE